MSSGSNPSRTPDAAILGIYIEEALLSVQVLGKADAGQPEEGRLETRIQALRRIESGASGLGLSGLHQFLRQCREAAEYLKIAGARSAPDADRLLQDTAAILTAWFETLRTDPASGFDLSAIRARIRALYPASDITEQQLEPPKPKLLGEVLVEQKLVTPEQVERAVQLQERKLGEVLVDEGAISKEALEKAVSTAAPAPKSVEGGIKKAAEQIRVPATRVDELLKIVGELSIHQSIVWHARQTGKLDTKAAQNAILLSNKIIRELQTQVMSLRLQPVKSLFQKLERVARDVSIHQKKKVEVRVEGAEVDLDKAVIEKITDPLQHIVRNGLDHGIETPEERVKAGKPEGAVLKIVAAQWPGEVMLTVSDDGRGMDPARLIRKATEKGFLQAGARLTPSEAFNLIFLPGFSTAEQVTEFSGRGVGMDVVNEVIRSLGGTVLIDSELGKGTTFSISLPTSVNLMDAVVFVVDGLRYVVPMRDLVEVIDLADFRLETAGSKGQMINLRGRVIPVERLHDYLLTARAALEGEHGKSGEVLAASAHRRPALLVDSRSGPIAFEVDGIAGQQQIVMRGLSGNMARIPACVGGTILGDGEPGVIIGLPQIARSYFDRVDGKGNA